MQTPLAIAAPLLAVLIWLLSRRRLPQLFVSGAASQGAVPGAVVALTQVLRPAVQAARPITGQVPAVAALAANGGGARPTGPQRLVQFRRAMAGPPAQRLAVLQQLAVQPDRACLPVIRLGLRDPHPAVVRLAAEAMASFRGRATAGVVAQPGIAEPRRLPRNAALLR